jgi:hypothetical protein
MKEANAAPLYFDFYAWNFTKQGNKSKLVARGNRTK